MLLDDDQCYRALKTHDARFDGRFFVGVGSTKIYCRPVCTARTPLKRNCRFYASAAAAEAQGYRPCLRCRPELAPGYAVVDANRRLAQSAAGMIEDGRLADANLESLAGVLGVTDRHLRRVFQQEFGVAPVEYAQTQRLLLAKRLLTDSDLPVIEVAMASGFASLRRFNHLFRTRYRLTPGQLRRKAKISSPNSRLRTRLLDVLQAEGFIRGYAEVESKGHKELEIELKYHEGEPVIRELKRVSTPGRRVYSSVSDLKPHRQGLGVSILSTPQGVMTDTSAREKNVGGEVLCQVF